MAPTTVLDLKEDIAFTIPFTANPVDPDPVNPDYPAGTEWNEEVIVEPIILEGGREATLTSTLEIEEIEELQPQVTTRVLGL